MTPEQFCYWLQGYSEVSEKQPTPAQWVVIQDHLKEVFQKKTPNRAGDNTVIAPYVFHQLPPAGSFPTLPNQQSQLIC